MYNIVIISYVANLVNKISSLCKQAFVIKTQPPTYAQLSGVWFESLVKMV